MPRENPDTSSSARSREPAASSAAGTTAPADQAVEPREELQILAGRQLGIEVQFVGEQADAAGECPDRPRDDGRSP